MTKNFLIERCGYSKMLKIVIVICQLKLFVLIYFIFVNQTIKYKYIRREILEKHEEDMYDLAILGHTVCNQ